MDKKIVAELRQQLAALKEKRAAGEKRATTSRPPRYDAVYYQGLAAMDEDLIPESPPMSIEDQAATVPPEVREYIGRMWAKEHGLLKDSD